MRERAERERGREKEREKEVEGKKKTLAAANDDNLSSLPIASSLATLFFSSCPLTPKKSLSW